MKTHSLEYYIKHLHKTPVRRIRSELNLNHVIDILSYLEKLDEYENEINSGRLIVNPFLAASEAISVAVKEITDRIAEVNWEEFNKSIAENKSSDDGLNPNQVYIDEWMAEENIEPTIGGAEDGACEDN